MARSGFSFELHGVKELERALKQLPKATAKTVLRRAASKALQPVAVDAEQRAPRLRGELAESVDVTTKLIRTQPGPTSKRGVTVYVGPTAPHGHLVEFGTSHSPAQPFLRPAWDGNKDLVLSIFKREIWTELARAAARLAKQAQAGKLGKAARRALGG
jgi:HK97 gp10 family phage protein